MYALSIDKETGRILRATYPQYATTEAVIIDVLPDGDITDYLYQDGEYVYNPRPTSETQTDPEQPNIEQRLAAAETTLSTHDEEITQIITGLEALANG